VAKTRLSSCLSSGVEGVSKKAFFGMLEQPESTTTHMASKRYWVISIMVIL